MLQSLEALWFFSNLFSPLPLTSSPTPQEEPPAVGVLPAAENQTPSPLATWKSGLKKHRWEEEGGEGSSGLTTPAAENQTLAPLATRKSWLKKHRREEEREGSGGITVSGYALRGSPGSIVSSLHRTVRLYGLTAVTGQPPVGEDYAVREHLKVWAHAVACAVR
ncbi:unnamed protein product [Spirodela intermedia]|uniref:Uncharacterized protein n=1 Tax=Spirodela intermedia TaxID=51605 RepID=A0A7I8KIK1_SPIIN|nr:unnamed protein product [Spirodela intermedia]